MEQARFGQAMQYALEWHGAQEMKGKGTPYMAHLFGVASITMLYGGDGDMAIGALLHDSLEDAHDPKEAERRRGVIEERFGEQVLEIVEACTDTTEHPKPDWWCQYGGRVMMTHYCSAHNQPRMRAEATSADPKSLTFNFVDATNLSSPSEGHMERLVVNFVDQDHFAQEWTFKVKDQKQVDVFTFQRD